MLQCDIMNVYLLEAYVMDATDCTVHIREIPADEATEECINTALESAGCGVMSVQIRKKLDKSWCLVLFASPAGAILYIKW